MAHHRSGMAGKERAWPGKKLIVPLLFPTGPVPVALLLCALPPGLPPKKHLNRMDGWCRSLPNPGEKNVRFKIDSVCDVCIGNVSLTPH